MVGIYIESGRLEFDGLLVLFINSFVMIDNMMIIGVLICIFFLLRKNWKIMKYRYYFGVKLKVWYFDI